MTDDSMMSILEFLPPAARMQLTRERLDLLGEIARLREALDVARSDLLNALPKKMPPTAAEEAEFSSALEVLQGCIESDIADDCRSLSESTVAAKDQLRNLWRSSLWRSR